jgi:cysteine desulfurase
LIADPVYLDYNATAPIRPGVVAAMTAALETVGNASSVHGAGRSARRALEGARRAVARLVGVEPAQVLFTSGGTEANNQALAAAGGAVLATRIEHDSVLGPAGAGAVLPVDGAGRLDLDRFTAMLEAERPALAAVMLANNETGVIQPVAAAAAVCRRLGVRLHVDAIQAAGKIPVDFPALGADSLSLSAHKLGGPQGVGALITAPGFEPPPLLRGGGQEQHRRAGTENLPGIVGFGAAAELALEDQGFEEWVGGLRDQLEAALQDLAPTARVFGHNADRLPNTSCIAFPGLASETLLIALDLAGIAVSSGSACSSGKVGPSHVLAAMGVPLELARSAIRISLGWASREADIERLLAALRTILERRDRAEASSGPLAISAADPT